VNEIQRKFIGALRSGQYGEGNLRLRWKGKYTPAGVLADLYLSSMNCPWDQAPWKWGKAGKVVWPDPHRHIGIPKVLASWAHIPLWVLVDLELLNDNEWSFTDLADYLEEKLKNQRPARRGRVASR